MAAKRLIKDMSQEPDEERSPRGEDARRIGINLGVRQASCVP